MSPDREKQLLERIRQLEELNSALQDKLDLIYEIVAPEDLMTRVEELTGTLAANAPLAVAGLKCAINEAASGALDRDTLAAVRDLCSQSEDHAEGVRAWAEKRPPKFKGR